MDINKSKHPNNGMSQQDSNLLPDDDKLTYNKANNKENKIMAKEMTREEALN